MNKELYTSFINDKRFTADPVAAEVFFLHNEVKSYIVDKIKLGKIRRYVKKKLTSIDKTLLYQLCCNPNNESLRSEYIQYCLDKQNTRDNPNRSLALFLSMLNSNIYTKYSPHKGVIVVDQYNCVVDGFHRSCILLKEYGADYIITVVRINVKAGMRIKILNFLFELRYRIRGKFYKLLKKGKNDNAKKGDH